MRNATPEVRELAAKWMEEGRSITEIAGLVGKNYTTVMRWYHRYRATGSIHSKRMGRPPKSKLDGHEQLIRHLIETNPVTTLNGLRLELWLRTRIMTSAATLCAYLAAYNITYKVITVFPQERLRLRNQQLRRDWIAILPELMALTVYYIDETWTMDNMIPLRARGEKGKRVQMFTPHSRYHKQTTIAALGPDGIAAAKVLKENVNGDVFLDFVVNDLIPNLEKGSAVVMDNLSSHKTKAIQKAFADAGIQVIYLPPYSPDFNPIEQVFSLLKQAIRKAQPRTFEEVEAKLYEVLDGVTADQAQNFIQSAIEKSCKVF